MPSTQSSLAMNGENRQPVEFEITLVEDQDFMKMTITSEEFREYTSNR